MGARSWEAWTSNERFLALATDPTIYRRTATWRYRFRLSIFPDVRRKYSKKSSVAFLVESFRKCVNPPIPALRLRPRPSLRFAQLEIPIGTMMELPRACVTADEIVGTDAVEFMSFGTNVRSRELHGFFSCASFTAATPPPPTNSPAAGAFVLSVPDCASIS